MEGDKRVRSDSLEAALQQEVKRLKRENASLAQQLSDSNKEAKELKELNETLQNSKNSLYIFRFTIKCKNLLSFFVDIPSVIRQQ